MAENTSETGITDGQSQDPGSSSMLRSSDLLEFFRVNAEFLPQASQYGDTHEKLEVSITSPLTNRKVSVKKWRRVKILGFGTASTVWLETCQDNEINQRAVKEISKKPRSFLRSKIDYGNELRALCQLSKYRDLFVHVLGWFESLEKLFVCLEYLPLGDLEHAVSNMLDEQEVKIIARQITRGLEILHKHNWVHRDLKPENIYVERGRPNWKVKIGDFGVSKRNNSEEDDRMSTQVGTPNFTAPEMISGILQNDTDQITYTSAVDLWSLGATIYSLQVGRVPFPSIQDLRNYCRSIIPMPSEPMLDKEVSEPGLAFVESLLEPDPKKRPPALEALDHPWLASSNLDYENFGSRFANSNNASETRHIQKIEARSGQDSPVNDRNANETSNGLHKNVSLTQVASSQASDSKSIQNLGNNKVEEPIPHQGEVTNRPDAKDLAIDGPDKDSDGSTETISIRTIDTENQQDKPRSFKPRRQRTDSPDGTSAIAHSHHRSSGNNELPGDGPMVTITGPHLTTTYTPHCTYVTNSRAQATVNRSTEKTSRPRETSASRGSKSSLKVEPESRDLTIRNPKPDMQTPARHGAKAIPTLETIDSEPEDSTNPGTYGGSQTKRQDWEQHAFPYNTTPNPGHSAYPSTNYYGTQYQPSQGNNHLYPSYAPLNPRMENPYQLPYYQSQLPPYWNVCIPELHHHFSTASAAAPPVPSPETNGETDNKERSKLEELKALFLADRQERGAEVATLLRRQKELESYLARLKEKASEANSSAEAGAAAKAAMTVLRDREEITEKVRTEAWQQGRLAGIKEMRRVPPDLESASTRQPPGTSTKGHDNHNPVILKDESGRSILLPYLRCRTWFGMQALIQRAFHSYEDVRATVAAGYYILKNEDDQVILPEVWGDFIQPGLVVEIEIRKATDDEVSDEDEDVHVFQDSFGRSPANTTGEDDDSHVRRRKRKVEEDDTDEDTTEDDSLSEKVSKSDDSTVASTKTSNKSLHEPKSSSTSDITDTLDERYTSLSVHPPTETTASEPDYDTSDETNSSSSAQGTSAMDSSISREPKTSRRARRKRESVSDAPSRKRKRSIATIRTHLGVSKAPATAFDSSSPVNRRALLSFRVWFVTAVLFLFGLLPLSLFARMDAQASAALRSKPPETRSPFVGAILEIFR